MDLKGNEQDIKTIAVQVSKMEADMKQMIEAMDDIRKGQQSINKLLEAIEKNV